jgi:hypothetical protein
VPRRVERQSEALAEPTVALRPEIGSRLRDREVDVEDNCAQHRAARIALPFVRAGTFAAFRIRDFRLIWGGQTVSFLGDAAFLVALGWRVTEMGGSLGYVLSVE